MICRPILKKAVKIGLIIFAALIGTITAIGINLSNTVQDGYAAWNTTKSVTAYIIRNGGILPQEWSDLADADPSFNAEDIESFQERIQITFNESTIEITVISGKTPIYNNPNQEIKDVILELDSPEDRRASLYWLAYRDLAPTIN